MRKEVEAFQQARVLFAARSEAAGTGGAIDLPMAISDACNVASRLMKAGLIIQDDLHTIAPAHLLRQASAEVAPIIYNSPFCNLGAI